MMTKNTLTTKAFLLCLLIGFLFINPLMAKMPAKIDRKINKYLKNHLMVKEFERTPILITKDKMGILEFNDYQDQLFDIKVKNESLGFIFIDKARSRYDEFSFMVFLSYDLEIKLVLVLDYNEIHGVEISNKGWLSQFVGFNPDSQIKYLENVDAISGATISSRSITVAIKELLPVRVPPGVGTTPC